MKKIIAIAFMLCLVIPVFAQKKLTEEEAQAQIATLKQQLSEAEAKISDLQSRVENLKSDINNLKNRKSELESKLAELQETWKRCQWGRYKVLEGDWLSKIASMREVYHDGSKWTMIYEANKDKIKDPNLIYPNWILLIPTLDTYKVIPGDCLSLIASYLSIYSDAKRWPEIYEANKDKIKDKDIIYPNQEFTIPHD